VYAANGSWVAPYSAIVAFEAFPGSKRKVSALPAASFRSSSVDVR
jgi:hypothetical protein